MLWRRAAVLGSLDKKPFTAEDAEEACEDSVVVNAAALV
jgi:hypothetical protein